MADDLPRFTVSDDEMWVAELTWTDKPENLGWFIHPFRWDGEYDHLTVEGFYDYTGQSAEEVFTAWRENPSYA